MRNAGIWLRATAAVLVLSSIAAAQDTGPGSRKHRFDMQGALQKVSKLLGQSEKLLVKSLKPKESSAAKNAKAGQAAKAGEKSANEMEKLLHQCQQSGEQAVRQMEEILKHARQSRSSSGGGVQPASRKSGESDAERRARERHSRKLDPNNSNRKGQGKRELNKKKTNAPRKKERQEKNTPPDLSKRWLPLLPEQFRQAYLNKDWGSIPQKWRDAIEEYAKRLSEMESKRNR